MDIKIFPSKINGELNAPSSKSFAQRALAASLLSNNETVITGYTASDDSEAAMSIIETLGAKVQQNSDEILVKGFLPDNKKRHIEINCGESGLSSRLFAPVTLLYAQNVTVNGKGSLLERPFGTLMQLPFEQMGINYHDNNGKLPLLLKGDITAKEINIDGSGGSQFLSGILMALPLLPHSTVVNVHNLKSRPYIDLTIELLSHFGVNITHNNYQVFNIPGNQHYYAKQYNIEGDWSGASCLLVAGAIGGRIKINNLNSASKQADKAIINVLQSAGCIVKIEEMSVTIEKNELKPFEFDATDCPDLFPALVALAANCKGISKIKGISRLATKESNRSLTLQTEFAKLGIKIELTGDFMNINGGEISGGTTCSHNDHRIAMALAVATVNAQAAVNITGAECVNKSYPGFWDDFKSL